MLTVGPNSSTEPPPGAKFQRIVYATNFGEASPAAAAYAVALAQEYQAYLTLLHVIERPKTGDLVHPHELEAATIERLRGLVAQEAELWCEPREAVLRSDLSFLISAYCRLFCIQIYLLTQPIAGCFEFRSIPVYCRLF